MNKLKALSLLDVRHNNLQTFNVDISNYNELNKLMLNFNNIRSIHESVFLHQTLITLVISSNLGLAFPKKIRLPNLLYFDARNNSVRLPSLLGKEQLPMISFLYLNGNFINDKGTFPNHFDQLSSTLIQLGIANCGLTSLPVYLNSFGRMNYLDARNNNISSVPIEVMEWIEENNIEIYLHNNTALCRNMDAKIGNICAPLCSKYCYLRNHKNNFCDESCNSKECHFDAGDCAG